jgi:hypothetical protein
MLNEGQILLKWQRLFSDHPVTPTSLATADQLIEQLRAESPVRFRLEQELHDIRQLQLPEASRLKPTRRKSAAKKT